LSAQCRKPRSADPAPDRVPAPISIALRDTLLYFVAPIFQTKKSWRFNSVAPTEDQHERTPLHSCWSHRPPRACLKNRCVISFKPTSLGRESSRIGVPIGARVTVAERQRSCRREPDRQRRSNLSCRTSRLCSLWPCRKSGCSGLPAPAQRAANVPKFCLGRI
jgi:hypothetical protein